MILALCALFCLPQDGCPKTLKEIGKALEDPARVFPVFQCLLREGETGKAHDVLTPASGKYLKSEELHLAFSMFEATRRMVFRTEVHQVRAGEEEGILRICNPEFGVGRDLRIRKFHGKIWLLDLNQEDVSYLKGRALGWFRHQVERADGWHFAYPPDWNYAPLARTCPCKR